MRRGNWEKVGGGLASVVCFRNGWVEVGGMGRFGRLIGFRDSFGGD